MAEKKRTGKYLTQEEFNKFKNNEFYHLKLQVKYLLAIALIILGAVISNFFVG